MSNQQSLRVLEQILLYPRSQDEETIFKSNKVKGWKSKKKVKHQTRVRGQLSSQNSSQQSKGFKGLVRTRVRDLYSVRARVRASILGQKPQSAISAGQISISARSEGADRFMTSA
ncbi:hypothetical protein OSB04_029317 [Centaurea solstitialis]|uniref:Uncharacterized protein n=1 Tax=Centaurea solstitialis TaxID=347529 RepID=A0AA38WC10_9ASTR|nr:hypothetical protein OSB04_029317 [Centaurea solstitialis]